MATPLWVDIFTTPQHLPTMADMFVLVCSVIWSVSHLTKWWNHAHGPPISEGHYKSPKEGIGWWIYFRRGKSGIPSRRPNIIMYYWLRCFPFHPGQDFSKTKRTPFIFSLEDSWQDNGTTRATSSQQLYLETTSRISLPEHSLFSGYFQIGVVVFFLYSLWMKENCQF